MEVASWLYFYWNRTSIRRKIAVCIVIVELILWISPIKYKKQFKVCYKTLFFLNWEIFSSKKVHPQFRETASLCSGFHRCADREKAGKLFLPIRPYLPRFFKRDGNFPLLQEGGDRGICVCSHCWFQQNVLFCSLSDGCTVWSCSRRCYRICSMLAAGPDLRADQWEYNWIEQKFSAFEDPASIEKRMGVSVIHALFRS